MTCSDCGLMFPCPCVSTCDLCGMIWNNRRESKCNNRVHKYDTEVAQALRSGYWTFREDGRLYKTQARTIQRIYQQLDKGLVFFSRKEFNQMARRTKTMPQVPA